MELPAATTKAVVLYVEDEAVNVLLMRMLFERRPQLCLEVATTGQQALAMAKRLHPALLLLDLRLPDCFGAELLTLLRREPGWQELPAIAVTAETGFVAEGSGFLEVWRKPMNLAFATARIDQLLGTNIDAAAGAADALQRTVQSHVNTRREVAGHAPMFPRSR
jgi:CheY-like chemotaxis protein